MDNTFCVDKRRMMDLGKSDVCPDYWTPISVVVIVSLTAALAGLWYRNEILIYLYNSNSSWLRLMVTHPDDINQHLPYDAFISFTHEDEAFVSQYLLPQLEGRYKLCLHFRDWMPGEMIGRNVIRSILSSRRTIIVMSPKYLKSTWGSYEFEIAHMEGFRNLVNRMVVIMYEDIDNTPVRESVNLYMRTVTYLKWDNTPNFWNRLHYKMPHPPEDSSRISCVLGWCWRRQRLEEGDLDQEELMEQMLRLRPLALVEEPSKDQGPSGTEQGKDIAKEQEILTNMIRLRNVVSVLRLIKDPGSCAPVKEDDTNLKDLLDKMMALRP